MISIKFDDDDTSILEIDPKDIEEAITTLITQISQISKEEENCEI